MNHPELGTPEWRLEQRKRHDYLEKLYKESGRKNSVYSGLIAERAAELVKRDRERSLQEEQK